MCVVARPDFTVEEDAIDVIRRKGGRQTENQDTE
jgi:hypothetical protein